MKRSVVPDQHPLAKAAFQRWDELKQNRTPHEQDWEDIARLIRPQRGGFSTTQRSRHRMEKPLSSEPIMASASFSAGIYAAITNPATRWCGFATPDKELNNWKPMASWLDIVTRRVFHSFSPSMSPFYAATFQAYSDISAFGNAAGYDEFDPYNRRFIDVSLSLAEVVIVVDAHGRVVEWLRRFELRPIAARREYRRPNDSLPQKLIDLAVKGDNAKIVFVKHILPNDDWRVGALGVRGKRWLSITACETDCALVRVNGYDDMPAYYPRWDVDSGMTYGTGPGFIALASARSNDLMERSKLRAAQFAAEPTVMAPDPDAMPLSGAIRPGGTVYGAVTLQGQRLLHQMNATPNIGLTIEEQRAKVEAIKDVFQYSIMSLTGRTGITSEESRIMEEARLRNWAPNADRLMEEYAARKAERRFNLLWRAGQLPPPPEGLPANMPLEVTYQSQATMALKAREAIQVRQFVGDLLPLAQLDPRYMDRLDPDALTEALHDASPGLPSSILRSRDEADQIGAKREEQMQATQMMELLERGGGAAKNIAGAMADGGTV